MKLLNFLLIIPLCLSVLQAVSIDQYMLAAIDAETRYDFVAAAKYNKILFDETKDIKYRNLWVESLLRGKQYNEAAAVCEKILINSDERHIRKLLALSYLGKGDKDKALSEAKKLIAKDKHFEDYMLVADIYASNKDNEKALEYYKSAYALSHNEIALDKIVVILYERQNNKEAKAYLETHLLQYATSEYLASKLAIIYANENNIDGVITAYKRIYAKRTDNVIGNKIIELYIIQKRYAELTVWLENTSFNDELLINIYKNDQKLSKASQLALKIYNQNGDIAYLAAYAALAYEAVDKKDNKLIDKTIRTFEQVVEKSNNHIHLNYLGYLLIDHNRDVERGIKLVELALESEPDNLYYTDSLAWGFYRLGDYAKAYELIKIVNDEMTDEPTVIEHYNLIKKKYETSLNKSKR